MSLNCTILQGNLTRDPELKHTASGHSVVNLGMAHNDTWTDASGQKHERTLFIDAFMWGKGGEALARNFHKGKPIIIHGKLLQENWQAADGTNKSKLRIEIKEWHYAGDSRSTGESTQTPPSPKGGRHNPRPPAGPSNSDNRRLHLTEEECTYDPIDDEIPF